MPIDKSKYPADWNAISLDLRAGRAGWRCEWCGAIHGLPHPVTGRRVSLQVAHLGIDKPDGLPGDKTDTMDCRPENLAVLCGKCHLDFDRNENVEKSIKTKIEQIARQREQAGQLPLF